MGKFEKLLDELLEAQDGATYWSGVRIIGPARFHDSIRSGAQEHKDRRDALLLQIIDRWGKMEKALEKARWVYDNWADLSNAEIEDMADELQAVLYPTKDVK